MIILIGQRVHSDDVSGLVLSDDFNYTHLCIPWFYDPDRLEDASGKKFATPIGWVDPRNERDEPAWPARFSDAAIRRLQGELGPYGFSAEFAQSPTPRGGGLIQRLWWRAWEPPDNRYPPFSFVFACLDVASTQKQTGDYSALTTWGCFLEPNSNIPALMLADSWAKRLPLHGERIPPRLPHEEIALGDSPKLKRRKNEAYIRRCGDGLGLIEWVTYACERFDVSHLLIENAQAGIVVAQEMRRLYQRQDWSVQLIKPIGDKYARAMSVVPLFTNGRIWAPVKPWAEEAIDNVAQFPFGKHDDILDSVVHAIRWHEITDLCNYARK